ncbi:2513_t:CDS:1, partial [Racocetra fulgida]
KIQWDQEKSKKKVFIRCENEPGEEAQGKKVSAAEKDYIFYLANPDITNEIKQMEIYSPSKGPEERSQL